jgi:CRISPR-associated endonuclease Cas1
MEVKCSHVSLNFGEGLGVDDGRTVIRSHGRVIPIEVSDFLAVSGKRSWISLDALHKLALDGVVVNLVGYNGVVESTFTPSEVKLKGALRLAQYRAATDEHRTFEIAKEFARTRVQTEYDLLHLLGLKAEPTSLPPKTSNLHGLNGYEGSNTTRYWAALGTLYKKAGHPLPARTSRHLQNIGATHPVFACQNYTLGILYSFCRRSAVESGLDCSVGFGHRNMDGKEPMVYDCVELGRFIAELATLNVVRKRLAQKDWWQSVRGRVFFADDLRKRLARETVRLLNLQIPWMESMGTRGNWSYAAILTANMQRLGKHLLNPKTPLKFSMPVSPALLEREI